MPQDEFPEEDFSIVDFLSKFEKGKSEDTDSSSLNLEGLDVFILFYKKVLNDTHDTRFASDITTKFVSFMLAQNFVQSLAQEAVQLLSSINVEEKNREDIRKDK